MFFFYIFVWVVPFVVVIAALVDIIRNEFDSGLNKLIWILVVIFIPLLGGILYYAIGQRNKSLKI